MRATSDTRAVDDGPFDPRAVANLLLDFADEEGIAIRHLKLQKLLYFAHGLFLIQTGRPLVSGHFEAWQRGPVHPAVYRAFRGAGAGPIAFRGEREDVMSGKRSVVAPIESRSARSVVRQVLLGLGHISDFDLVDLSHAKRGPWHHVVEQMRLGVALGARIDDSIICARFFRHKWIVKAGAREEGQTDARREERSFAIEKPYSAAYRAGK